MSRIPLSPDIWEQALINGRRAFPSDDSAAGGFAEGWYAEQGGRFQSDQPEAPQAPVAAPVLVAPVRPQPIASEAPQEPASNPLARPEAKPVRRRKVADKNDQA